MNGNLFARLAGGFPADRERSSWRPPTALR